MRKIHITGPAGAGTMTLGAALSRALGAVHLDTDDFFWEPSDPPFTLRRPVADRLALLSRDMNAAEKWVLSGSAMGWGDRLLEDCDAVIFLYVAPDIRIPRLVARERARYGEAIAPGGRMHDQHLAFLEWARGYEDPLHDGRNLARHEAWLAKLPCPVIRLDGRMPVEQLVEEVASTVTATP